MRETRQERKTYLAVVPRRPRESTGQVMKVIKKNRIDAERLRKKKEEERRNSRARRGKPKEGGRPLSHLASTRPALPGERPPLLHQMEVRLAMRKGRHPRRRLGARKGGGRSSRPGYLTVSLQAAASEESGHQYARSNAGNARRGHRACAKASRRARKGGKRKKDGPAARPTLRSHPAPP